MEHAEWSHLEASGWSFGASGSSSHWLSGHDSGQSLSMAAISLEQDSEEAKIAYESPSMGTWAGHLQRPPQQVYLRRSLRGGTGGAKHRCTVLGVDFTKLLSIGLYQFTSLPTTSESACVGIIYDLIRLVYY